jgi:hypothetical protein
MFENLPVHTLDGIHDHPRPSIRSKLCYKRVVRADVVLLHSLCVHSQLNLSADKIGSSIGLDDERVLAQLHEGIASGACHLVARKRSLVLVDQHLPLALGECLNFAAIWERNGVEVHLG